MFVGLLLTWVLAMMPGRSIGSSSTCFTGLMLDFPGAFSWAKGWQGEHSSQALLSLPPGSGRWWEQPHAGPGHHCPLWGQL